MVVDSNKWITVFFMSFITFTFLTISVVFFMDPFLYYRNISNDKKLMEPRYTNIGLIKNVKHNMTIIGLDSNNSMDMLYIRNFHERRPIQLGIDDGGLNEVLMLYILSQENSNVDLYFMNVDLEDFLKDEAITLSTFKFPQYLYNKNKLDDIKYLLNYEICFRYVFLNTYIDLAFKVGKSLPQAYQEGTEIDKVIKWKKRVTLVPNMAKGVKSIFTLEEADKLLYASSKNECGFSHELNYSKIKDCKVDLKNVTIDPKVVEEKVDIYVNIIEDKLKENQMLVFGFIPYSKKYWEHFEKDEYNNMMWAKNLLIQKVKDNPNIKIVDLHGIPQTKESQFYVDDFTLSEDLLKIYADAIFSDNK